MRKISYRTQVLLIIGVIILLFIGGCSLILPSDISDELFPNSIAWLDNENFLIFRNINKYVNYGITGPNGYYEWVMGEIWKVNVVTGEKELMFQEKGYTYYYDERTRTHPVHISVLGDKQAISMEGNTYLCEDFSRNWREIKGIASSEWVNDSQLIGIDISDYNIVKYNYETLEREILATLDTEEYPTYLEYDMQTSEYVVAKRTELILFTYSDNIIHLDADTVYVDDKEYRSPYFYGISFTNNQVLACVNCWEENIAIRNFSFIYQNSDLINIIYYNNFELYPSTDLQYIVACEPPFPKELHILDKDLNLLHTVTFEADY